MKPWFSNWSIWKNETWFLVSKHQKERAIFPVLKKKGIDKFQVVQADTDELGTFSGEIPRNLSIEDTLLAKCKLGIQEKNQRILVATEGSFGPHPVFPWVAQHQESFLLLDQWTNQKHFFHHFSNITNFAVAELNHSSPLVEFCQQAKFPSHSIILKEKNGQKRWKKDISNWPELWETFHCFGNPVLVETDMRAMNNPTRMSQIREGFVKFLDFLSMECPQCHYPGFHEKKVDRGLPCSLCHLPTPSVLQSFQVCENCNYEKIKKYPHGKSEEDPMYCLNCNP